jgi:hypothetical protein
VFFNDEDNDEDDENNEDDRFNDHDPNERKGENYNNLLEEGSYASSRSKRTTGGGGGSFYSSSQQDNNNNLIDPLAYLGIGDDDENNSQISRENIEISQENSIGKDDGDNKGCQTKKKTEVVNHSIQFNPNDLPAGWKTNSQLLQEEILIKKEQLITQEKALNSVLTDFYENFQLIIYEFLPKEKFDIFNFDYKKHKETWQYE